MHSHQDEKVAQREKKKHACTRPLKETLAVPQSQFNWDKPSQEQELSS